MKITCSRRDEILEEKRKYEEAESVVKKKMEEEDLQYREARRDVLQPLKDELEHYLRHVDDLHLVIDVSTDSDFRMKDTKYETASYIKVKVACSERHMHDEGTSLTWDFSVYVDPFTGEVKKDSGSWSGLNAVTDAQLDHLQKSVDVLKQLNSIDWKTFLDKSLPEYRDYHKTPGIIPGYESGKPDFDSQLIEEDIKDAVGRPIGFKAHPWGETNRWSRDKYVFIVRATPSRFQVGTVDAYNIENASDEEKKQRYEDAIRYLTGVNKSTLMKALYRPLKTIEIK